MADAQTAALGRLRAHLSPRLYGGARTAASDCPTPKKTIKQNDPIKNADDNWAGFRIIT